MKNYTVRLYQKTDYSVWNSFVETAKNATFLFHRDFMEYHADKFNDYSLLVFENKKLVAIVPANCVGETVYSHQGLSYGGIIINDDLSIKDYLEIGKNLMLFLNENGINYLELKQLPKIYNATISDEIDVLNFIMKSKNFRTDTYFIIDNSASKQPNRNRQRAISKANNINIQVIEDKNYSEFWDKILTPNLNTRFNVNPVHSEKEITDLANLFQDNIKLFNAYQDSELIAGVVIFNTFSVAHFQYSSGNEARADNAGLDILFDYIVKKYSYKKYISFGSSSENNGLNINFGLSYWKESFGATASTQNFYRFETKNHILIDNVLNS